MSSRKRRHPTTAETPGENGNSSDNPFRTASSQQILEWIESPNWEELCRSRPSFAVEYRKVQQSQQQARQSANPYYEKKSGKASFGSVVTPTFSLELTRALLHTYFQLDLAVFPYETHLCPPVPNRFFYLHWLHSIVLPQVDAFDEWSNTNGATNRFGFDLGVGASCIYPLLASKFFDTTMYGTEIDEASFRVAMQNVQANPSVSRKIHLAVVPPAQSQQEQQNSAPMKPGGPIVRALEAFSGSPSQLDYVMTNPPFHEKPHALVEDLSSDTVAHRKRAGDGRLYTPMTINEGWYPEGEVGFVLDMLVDSIHHPFASKIYSSMLGKKSSWTKVVALLRHVVGPSRVWATEYQPGQYTRWFVAWTWGRPPAVGPTTWFDVPATSSSFVVEIPATDNDEDMEDTYNNDEKCISSRNLQTVLDRVKVFCHEQPSTRPLVAMNCQGLQCQELKDDSDMKEKLDTKTNAPSMSGPAFRLRITEVDFPNIHLYMDEGKSDDAHHALPDRLRHALEQHSSKLVWLPSQVGHFVLDLRLFQEDAHTVQVHVQGHRHSARGQHVCQHLISVLAGEIGRTNRKWRRKLKQKSQETKDAMDVG